MFNYEPQCRQPLDSIYVGKTQQLCFLHLKSIVFLTVHESRKTGPINKQCKEINCLSFPGESFIPKDPMIHVDYSSLAFKTFASDAKVARLKNSSLVHFLRRAKRIH